jgi:hypothetical protein
LRLKALLPVTGDVFTSIFQAAAASGNCGNQLEVTFLVL